MALADDFQHVAESAVCHGVAQGGEGAVASGAQFGDDGLGIGPHLFLTDGFVAGHAEYLKADFPARFEIFHHRPRRAAFRVRRNHGKNDIRRTKDIRRAEREILGVAGADAHAV